MLKISTIKENCFPAMYQRGKLLAEKKAYKSFLIEEGAEGIKEVSAQVKGSGSKWYDVTVTFDLMMTLWIMSAVVRHMEIILVCASTARLWHLPTGTPKRRGIPGGSWISL